MCALVGRAHRAADRHQANRTVADISRAQIDGSRCARGENEKDQINSLGEKLTDLAVFG